MFGGIAGSGYDKSPDYAPQGSRSTLASWMIADLAAATTAALLFT